MSDLLDETGLTVKTASEITSDIATDLRAAYGDDINLDQNSPDGQLVGIITQLAIDLRELLVGINNGFDPDQALGDLLDQRVTINNIERKGGTYTVQPVSITVDRTVTLQGLDADYDLTTGTGYTVQDNAGTQFILADTTTLTAGTHSLNFRAKSLGAVDVTVGTITNPVTVVLGVTAVNNPSAALQIGENQETDAQLRVRRESSIANNSIGYIDGLRGSLLDITGVSEAKVFLNNSNSTDSDGTPEHCIWSIVEGGANSDIGQLLYAKAAYGSSLRGAVEVAIDTASGGVFTAKFDRPSAENLYIRFDIQRTVTGYAFDTDGIKSYMASNIDYSIGQFAHTATLTADALTAINSLGGGGVPVNVEISKDGTNWFDYLETTTKDKQFTVDETRITITVL